MVVCKYFQQGYCRFGQNCRNEHVYSSKYSYRAPQTHSSGHENFNSYDTGHSFGSSNASTSMRRAVQNTSVFQNPPSNSVFAPNPATRSSVFDRLGSQQNQAKSIFAQANQNSFGSVQPNVFQVQNQVSAKSLFAQTNQNIFGQSQTNQNIFGQSQTNQNFFGQSQTNQNIFGHSQTNFNQAQTVAANVFATANQNLPSDPFKQQSNTFSNSGNVFQINNRPSSNPFGVMIEETISVEDNVYSKMEELTKSVIEAFESADFKLGFVPEMPPPRALCV